jgi:hypothetical protein
MSTSDSFFINHPHLVQLILALCIVVAILINIYNLRRPDPYVSIRILHTPPILHNRS